MRAVGLAAADDRLVAEADVAPDELRPEAPGVPALMLDPHRIWQIAFNLMGNAVKFTKKGFIEIRLSFRPDEGSRTGELRMEVEDTGCGIREEDLKKLARPFIQVGSISQQRSGTGLGLHICRMLSRAMGGDMEISSAVGKGTTFSIVIPGVKVADPGSSGGGKPADDAARRARLHVLVVDDTKMNQMVLKAMFKRLGVTDLAYADNGREALDVISAQGDRKFDLIITDAWMPEMTGMELVSAIRADPSVSSTPVYLFTAEVEMKDSYAEKGFDGVLLKPANVDVLRKLLP